MKNSTQKMRITAYTQAAPGLGETAHRLGTGKTDRFQDVLTMAKDTGLLKGARTEFVRGRMPKALVAKAKARSGIQSDTKLIEVALANLALADDYPSWLLAQHGTISTDVDVEF